MPRPIRFKSKPSWRESANEYAGRPILVALEPGAVLVRLKKKCAVYRIPIDYVFRVGAALEARRLQAERKEARKSRGKDRSEKNSRA